MMLLAVGLTHGFVYVEGGSMAPTLVPGDVIVYRRRVPQFERDDLVLFEHNGGLVVHRVAGIQRDGALRTRGDANERVDSQPVHPDDVRGCVVFVLPVGRAADRLAGLAH